MTAPDTLDGAELMRGFVPASPMVQHLGITLEELADGYARLAMPFAEHLVTIDRMVHGGAIATLADTAAMAASWVGAEIPANLRGSTVDLTVHYLAPALAVDLVAEARVLRRGRSLVHLAVEVATSGGEQVAHAVATYKLG